MPSTSTLRRIAVALTGGAVTLVGIAMLVVPGPAIVVIPIGLAILAVEFRWARRWMAMLKSGAQEPRHWWRSRRAAGDGDLRGGSCHIEKVDENVVEEKI